MASRQTESGLSIGINNTMISLQNGTPLSERQKPAEFIIKVANTLEEREAVFHLGYQIYLEKGFINQNPQEWLIQSYDANPETVILIVQDQNKKIAGSLTLVFDGNSKLPAEKIYGEEINELKTKGERMVEISRLVVCHEYRNAKEVLLLLMNYLMIYTYHVKSYSSLIIQVNPRHKTYYKALLNFDELGNEKSCPSVQNAPAVLLHLPLSRSQSEVKRLAGTFDPNKKERSLYTHFLNLEQEKLVAHYLEKQTKPITLEEKIYFGLTESGVNRAVCV